MSEFFRAAGVLAIAGQLLVGVRCGSHNDGEKSAAIEGKPQNASLPALPTDTPLSQSRYSTTVPNRITSWGYDNNGNVTQIANMARSFTYDAENNQVTATIGSGTSTYVYNGPGQRVSKTVSGQTTTYVYDAFGNLAAEYGGTPDSTCTGTCYVTTDHLGSTRMLTNSTGGVVARYDYEPFGQEIGAGYDGRTAPLGYTSPPDATNPKFTAKERDAETGLDYFGARYMSAAQGRWTSPDVLNLTDERVLNPSNTLNKYVYGGNNPLKYVDPDGRDITIFYESPSLFPPGAGHILFTAENEQNGNAAVMSFGPVREGFGDAERTLAGFPQVSTSEFGLAGATTDQLKQQYSALTITTTPEEAQQVIDWIKQHGGVEALAGGYMLYDQNCTTVCREALKMINKLAQGNKDWTPTGLWKTLFSNYAHPYWQNNFNWVGSQPGIDYGQPRGGYDPFRSWRFSQTALMPRKPGMIRRILSPPTATELENAYVHAVRRKQGTSR